MNEKENSIDCIFDINGTHTVLVKRGNEPFKGYWALPGGRQKNGETLDETLVREINEEIKANITFMNNEVPYKINIFGENSRLEQVWTYDSGKDPRGGNTTVYAISLNMNPEDVLRYLKPGDDASDLAVVGLHEVRGLDLAFDHFDFLRDYYKKFKKYNNPIPTTDLIIEHVDNYGKEGIVLIERKNPPYGLALPGGFAEYGITLDTNAKKEAMEETNLEFMIDNPEKPFLIKSDPNRDPRGHLISVTYVGKGYGNLLGGDDAKNAKVYGANELKTLIDNKGLAFDHADILFEYLKDKKYV
jgi:8-oxo-dGTP diphosphatase